MAYVLIVGVERYLADTGRVGQTFAGDYPATML